MNMNWTGTFVWCTKEDYDNARELRLYNEIAWICGFLLQDDEFMSKRTSILSLAPRVQQIFWGWANNVPIRIEG